MPNRPGPVSALLRVALMSTLQYRSNFLISFVIGACNAFGVIVPLLFLYDHVPAVGGWSLPESVLVISFFMIMTGLIGTVVEPNLGAIVDGVRTGKLDYMLIRPVDTQLLATVQKVDPTRIWDILAGLGLGGWALLRMPTPSLEQMLMAFLVFIAGMASIYSLWLLVICLSFWFVRVDNLRFLLGAAADAGRWPVVVWRGWLRTLLTLVLPVCIVTSYPVMALSNRLSWETALEAVGVGAFALVLSRWAWLKALGFYSSASS